MAETELKASAQLWKTASGGGKLEQSTSQAHARRWELEIMGEGAVRENDLVEMRVRRRRDTLVKQGIQKEVQEFYERRERERSLDERKAMLREKQARALESAALVMEEHDRDGSEPRPEEMERGSESAHDGPDAAKGVLVSREVVSDMVHDTGRHSPTHRHSSTHQGNTGDALASIFSWQLISCSMDGFRFRGVLAFRAKR